MKNILNMCRYKRPFNTTALQTLPNVGIVRKEIQFMAELVWSNDYGVAVGYGFNNKQWQGGALVQGEPVMVPFRQTQSGHGMII